jgi:hypothetical protein
LQSYTNVIHILVVSDASEAGPGFYQAVRASSQEPSCDNPDLVSYKSSQIYSPTGFESAADNSLFAQTFSNALINNLKQCIPIESIVRNSTAVVAGFTTCRMQHYASVYTTRVTKGY